MCLPAHTTHKMQRLDKAVGTLNNYYSKGVQVFLHVQCGFNAIKNIEATSLYPVRPYIFEKSDFVIATFELGNTST